MEEIDFDARFYDQQLGVLHNQDPAGQFASPYLAMGNNPVIYADPNGKFVFLVVAIAAVVGGSLNTLANKDNIHNFWQGLGYFGAGAGGAVADLYLGPAAGFGIGGAATILNDGAASGFKNLDFRDYLDDFPNGGESALSGGNAALDNATSTGGWGGTKGDGRWLGEDSKGGFSNKVANFFNGGKNGGFSGFLSQNLSSGITNVVNQYAQDKAGNNNIWDYLGYLGSGIASSAVSNKFFLAGDNNAKDISSHGNFFKRNFVSNALQSGLNNTISSIDNGGSLGYYLSSFYQGIFPGFRNTDGDFDYSNVLGDLPLIDWRTAH